MRLMSALVASVALAVLPALPAAAGDADGERITSYEVDLQVRADGSLQVQETIAYDFGTEARRGIRRDIDTEQRYDDGRNRRFPVSDVQVGSATAPARVEVTGGGSRTSLRIGDPDRTVSGRHTYRISYTVAAATTRYDDRDELSWNAVGPGWDVPIADVRVRVGGAPVTRSACVAGDPGGTTPCDSAEAGTFGQAALAPGQALTVVAAFPAGSVATAAPVLSDRMTAGRFLAGNPAVAVPGVLLGVGGPALLLARGLRRRRAREAPGLPHRGRFQPQPPPGLRPLLANTLLGGGAKPVDAIAVLLDLSARGLVSITPLPDGWRLVAVRPPDASEPPEVHEIVRAVFADGPDTTLRDAAGRLRGTRARLRDLARDGVVEQGWFSRRPAWPVGEVVLGGLVALAGIPLTVALGISARAGIVGPALVVGGILVLVHASFRAQPRTEAGEVARSQLLAFKDTLARTDPGQVPAEQREAALGGLLPYAVVLGLAPQLAAGFLAAGAVSGGYAAAANPVWWSTFAADATRATSTDSSSSGGGPGGSVGGGVGSGGGGGGGGSW